MSTITPRMVRKAAAEFAFEINHGAAIEDAMSSALRESGIADLVDQAEQTEGLAAERAFVARRAVADVTGSPV
jgi:hypothetical protein